MNPFSDKKGRTEYFSKYKPLEEVCSTHGSQYHENKEGEHLAASQKLGPTIINNFITHIFTLSILTVQTTILSAA